MASWNQIPSSELSAAKIPSRGASWEDVKRFAGSFNYADSDADRYQKVWSRARTDFLGGNKGGLDGLDLSELRAVLFLHWRALRHVYCGAEPSSSEMAYTWDLVEAIRRKVETLERSN